MEEIVNFLLRIKMKLIIVALWILKIQTKPGAQPRLIQMEFTFRAMDILGSVQVNVTNATIVI